MLPPLKRSRKEKAKAPRILEVKLAVNYATFANQTEFLQHSKSVIVMRLYESALLNCFVLDFTGTWYSSTSSRAQV